jgi:AcrR family transcriptional regulator
MGSAVKGKRRPYDSPLRREQAAATRRQILEAAQRLFERHGYGATTMNAIAAEAGVAPKTVYLAFETKSGVLRALWNLRIRAGRDELPVAEQPWYREVLEARDPERQLRLNARNSCAAKLRVASVLGVIHTAAPLDADIGALWERIFAEYHANQRVIVKGLAEKKALRPELDLDQATDTLWTINHPHIWQLLVRECGWSPEQYEQWTGAVACSQLLKPKRRSS